MQPYITATESMTQWSVNMLFGSKAVKAKPHWVVDGHRVHQQGQRTHDKQNPSDDVHGGESFFLRSGF
jgi:hypothetical protein